tara:strand:+ start:56 stop:661 length:606 start_codon:yes stop_codon:yes gene_type:complete
MTKGLKILAFSIIVITATMTLVVFSTPYSGFTTTVERFQTFVGGAVAAIAAIVASLVLYASATAPQKQARRDQETVAAAFLLPFFIGAKASVSAYIIAAEENALSEVEPSSEIHPVETPSFDILKALSPSVAREIGHALARLDWAIRSVRIHSRKNATEDDRTHLIEGLQITTMVLDHTIAMLNEISQREIESAGTDPSST